MIRPAIKPRYVCIRVRERKSGERERERERERESIFEDWMDLGWRKEMQVYSRNYKNTLLSKLNIYFESPYSEQSEGWILKKKPKEDVKNMKTTVNFKS